LAKSKITQDSAIAGGPPAEGDPVERRGRRRRGLRPFESIASKMVVLLIILCAVPIIIYAQFVDADREKRTLLLQSVQEQGRLTGQALLPLLAASDGSLPLDRLREELARVAGDHANVKVLFRPRGSTVEEEFYYVAAHPTVPNTQLNEERQKLIEQGVLGRLAGTCIGGEPLAIRYATPAGAAEILTSITPVNTMQGCWAVITSLSAGEFLGEAIGRPYWARPEVRLAGLIYIAMVLITLTIFFGVWRNIRRFGRAAREIRREGENAPRFVDLNRVPELDGVARDFDRLVQALQDSARNIRSAAEENAHALKTPIAIIRQSLEPIKRVVMTATGREARAVSMIETSVDRLDALVSSARLMDEADADLVDPPTERVDLSHMLSRIVGGYGELTGNRGLNLEVDIAENLNVIASEDLLETVAENLLDNAISFSPPGATLGVSLRSLGNEAILMVEDEGPGVPPENLTRIFERYYSSRPESGAAVDGIDPDDQHFGIGLWIVRRNVSAVGGRVEAENRPEGGLRVSVSFPLVD